MGGGKGGWWWWHHVMVVVMTSSKYQNVKIKSVVDWGRSILVNGILYLRLFGDLEMTSSKYQNVKINFDSGSNLRRALGNMYHHVIHDSMRQARVSCLMEGFPRVWVSQGTPKPPGNFVNASNLRRALGIVYHHVIHDSKRSAQVWWLMEGFPGVLSHPGRHTGPRKNTFFGFKNRENTYSSEKQF